MKTKMKAIKHGTLTGYGHWKCRCEDCKAAKAKNNSINNAKCNMRALKKLRAVPEHPLRKIK